MKNCLLFLALFSLALSVSSQTDKRLAGSSRYEKAGWIYIHLEGSPAQIGFQHGYLLAPEIDDALKMFKYFYPKTTGRDWAFYRKAAHDLFIPKIEKEYIDELNGMVEGLKAKGKNYDLEDMVVSNGVIELAQYYVPWLDEKKKPGSGLNKAPGNCSAFIANGDYTSDGKIVMGHNAWTDFIVGERWNIIADIVPEKGYRMFMDIFPGWIQSGDDFAINGAGMLITETTITQFNGFNEKGSPEFVRSRRAEQYAGSIDDFVRIMVKDNNGGYANDWLVGNINTNEIARLELGLKNHRVWRTKNGMYVGSNFASDPKLIAEETNFKTNDRNSSPNARKLRWETLQKEYKGKINPETGMQMESDSYNQLKNAKEASRCVIAGRTDNDPKGCPEWGWKPYYPGGTVQGKITTSALAREFKFWAHMGNTSGDDFIAAPFFQLHPEYKWQSAFLHDMKSHPWTLFEADRKKLP